MPNIFGWLHLRIVEKRYQHFRNTEKFARNWKKKLEQPKDFHESIK